MAEETTTETPKTIPGPGMMARLAIGGFLMGAANLVPGISGGTMLVAAGVYQTFIDAVGDAARLRFSARTLVVLGVAVAAAGLAFVVLSGVVVWGLTEFRWGMYSLFIGLTLGGVPVMVALVRAAGGGRPRPARDAPARRAAPWIAGALGAAAMGALALVQAGGATGGGGPGSGPGAIALYALGGVAGAASMILPGLSGAFVLLVLGLYEPIVGAIKDAIRAAADLDIGGVAAELAVLIPVGIGVVVGVGGIGSLLKWLLRHHERVTLAFLLGLLVAAPLGLYPFRRGIEPQIGDIVKGAAIETEEQLAEARAEPKDWRQELYRPEPPEVLASVGLVAVGFGATVGIGLIGGRRGPAPEPNPEPQSKTPPGETSAAEPPVKDSPGSAPR